MNGDDDQRRYIAKVLARTGWTQTQLAQRAALDPSTLSRFLNGGREGHTLRASTLTKIAAVSGLPVDGEPPAPPAGFAESEAQPILPGERPDLANVIASLTTPGRAIDPWRLTSRALENAGYRAGDIALVALDETPLAGDVVCAQIYDWGKGGAQTVFRLFQPPFLVAACNDPALMRPFSTSDGNVVVKGVVVCSIRGRASS